MRLSKRLPPSLFGIAEAIRWANSHDNTIGKLKRAKSCCMVPSKRGNLRWTRWSTPQSTLLESFSPCLHCVVVALLLDLFIYSRLERLAYVLQMFESSLRRAKWNIVHCRYIFSRIACGTSGATLSPWTLKPRARVHRISSTACGDNADRHTLAFSTGKHSRAAVLLQLHSFRPPGALLDDSSTGAFWTQVSLLAFAM